MGATLNRNKPFGEVYGEGVTHRFEQDGKLFDNAGNEIEAQPEPQEPQDQASEPAADAAPARRGRKPKQVDQASEPAADAGADQISAQMAG